MLRMIFLLSILLLCIPFVLGSELGVDYALPHSTGSRGAFSWAIQNTSSCTWDGGEERSCTGLREIEYSGSGGQLPRAIRNPAFNRRVDNLSFSVSTTHTNVSVQHLHTTCLREERTRLTTLLNESRASYRSEMIVWRALRQEAYVCDRLLWNLSTDDKLLHPACLSTMEEYHTTPQPEHEYTRREFRIDLSMSRASCTFNSTVKLWSDFAEIDPLTFTPPSSFALLQSWEQDTRPNRYNPDVGVCSTLTQNDTTYTQNQTATTTGVDCWTFKPGLHNVTFDCQGFQTLILPPTGTTAAFTGTGVHNITLLNCEAGNGSNFMHNKPFEFYQSTGITITNFFDNDNANSNGAWLDEVNNSIITNYTSTAFFGGLQITDSINVTLRNSNISSYGSSGLAYNNTARNVIARALEVSFSGLDDMSGASGNVYDCEHNASIGTGGIQQFPDYNVTNCLVASSTNYGIRSGSNTNYFNVTVTGSTEGIRIEQDNLLFSNITVENAADAGINFKQFPDNVTFEGLNMQYNGSLRGIRVHQIDNTNNRVDCQGGLIRGNDTSSSIGVEIEPDPENFTLQNCLIHDFTYGIYLYEVTNPHLFTGISTSSNGAAGVYIDGSDNQTFINHTVLGDTSQAGVQFISHVTNFTIHVPDNNIVENLYGDGQGVTGAIIRHDATGGNNTHTNLTGVANGSGLSYIYYSSNVPIGTNTFDCKGNTIEGVSTSIGVNVLVGGDHITVKNCTFANHKTGVKVDGASIFVVLEDLSIINTTDAISLSGTNANPSTNTATRISIENATTTCLASATRFDTFELHDSTCNNTMVTSGGSCYRKGVQAVQGYKFIDYNCYPGTGIDAFDRITGNAQDNYVWHRLGCYGQGTNECIRISAGDNSDIINSTIQNFSTGILITGANSDGHTITGNTIQDNAVGIDIGIATDTGITLTDNLLCQNTLDANDADANTWTGNQCNTTTGAASCTSIPFECPVPVADARWLLIKATPFWHVLYKDDGSSRILLRI